MADKTYSSMLREVKAVGLGLRALLRSQPLQHSLVAWVSDCQVPSLWLPGIRHASKTQMYLTARPQAGSAPVLR